MVKRRKKKLKKILSKLIEGGGALNPNPGKRIGTSYRITKKDKRRKGWKTPCLIQPTEKYKAINEDPDLQPEPFYDEWASYKDGFRAKHESERQMEPDKVKTKLAIRKARKLRAKVRTS